MKKIAFILCLLMTFHSWAQTNDREKVMDVVNTVLEAMRASDSTLLKSCFVGKPTTFTVFRNVEGKTQLKSGDFQRFMDAVGTYKEQTWNEPIWNEKVEIADNLASVWVDYAFYIDDQFSHCGVDAFHLVKLDEQWKIFHLVDTRRKEPCEIPGSIKARLQSR